MARDGQVIRAVLGPTNTGKTHYAIERMLAYDSGVIGLPLRLLAREVYDRIVALRGPGVVALVTGEERIVPTRPKYWVATTEAMPQEIGADFVAIDEIQLCADPERGHVFTDRLLRARGRKETLFLGSDTMRSAIAALVPGVDFMTRERFSTLTYVGSKKISRMPARSAIVAFSVDNVYAIAELVRRQRGGAAVVLGALSPRTRNAQVELYQNGDVDFMIATDAIGMGLNLDVDHVAFAGLSKFDGHRMRQLAPNELAQIAGRAGRYTAPGTFGVTGEARPIHDEAVSAIEAHRFTPISHLQWRNHRLDFGSTASLIASLERSGDTPMLVRGRDADDLVALRTLAESDGVAGRIGSARDVQLLWDICRIPDFRNITPGEHAALLEKVFTFVHDNGHVPDDWLAGQLRRIDRMDGEIDTLSKRLAFVRTWTYVSQRRNWVEDPDHWRDRTRDVEDRLSDALHARLTQRFVDRRTSVLMRRLKQKEALVAVVNENGEVRVEDQFVGKLEGFRFLQDETASGDEGKLLRSAAYKSLAPEFSLRSDRLYAAPDTEFDITEQGGLMWGEHAVGKLTKGATRLTPQVQVFVDDEAGADIAEKVARRLQHFVDRRIAALFEPMVAMQDDATLEGLARGFAFQLAEAMGILPRVAVADEVKALDQDMRGTLRKHGVRFGQFTIFMPALLKPAPTRLRLVLWGLWEDHQDFAAAPPPGLVTVPVTDGQEDAYFTCSGYRRAGARAIRVDMAERLADMLRGQDSRGGFEANADMLSITGLTLEQFADLMAGLGYKAERGERPKTPAQAEPAPSDADAGDGAETGANGQQTESAAETDPQSAREETSTSANEGDVADSEAVAADNGATPDGETASEEIAGADEKDPEIKEPEIEVFYTFTWAPRRAPRPRPRADENGDRGGKGRPDQSKRPRGKGQRKGKPAKGGGKPARHSAGPTNKGKPRQVDPDNPFAALMSLKEKL